MAGLSIQGFMHHAGRLGGADECAAGTANAADTVHGGFDAIQRNAASIIVRRPLSAEPVPSLFDCREFLNVASCGNREVQGFAPVDFYHSPHMGTNSTAYKPHAHCTPTDSTKRDE